MRTFHADTMTELHDKLCDKLVLSRADKLDVISSVDVQIHNVIAQAEHMSWDFDLKSMWLTPSRWSMMVKQYLDPDSFDVWMDQITSKIGTRNRGIAVMRTRTVAARGGAATGHTNKETRRWGSCMLAVSYKAVPRPTIVLHSRTSYLGYIGALDLSVAWMCARYIAQALGTEPEDISFVWMNEAIQWHNFKSLAYLLNHKEEDLAQMYRRLLRKRSEKLRDTEKLLLESSPALTLSRNWLQKLIASDRAGDTYGDMTYNTYRRIRRRYHTEVLGYDKAKQFEGWSHYKTGPNEGEQKEFFKAYQPLPHCHIKDRDFSAIGRPLAGVEAVAEPEAHGFDDEDDE